MATQRPNTRGRQTELEEDRNMVAAGLLFDMAELQGSERSRFGYKRAAKAIVALPAPVDDVVRSGAVADVQYIGPPASVFSRS